MHGSWINDIDPLGMDTFTNLVLPRGLLYTFPSKGAMMQLLHMIRALLFSIIYRVIVPGGTGT